MLLRPVNQWWISCSSSRIFWTTSTVNLRIFKYLIETTNSSKEVLMNFRTFFDLDADRPLHMHNIELIREPSTNQAIQGVCLCKKEEAEHLERNS
ncbi:hypothetical protein AVEN_184459-1 [Araneus ventricosus]|uniref:Uncharacterized protein n=1 Tax=Araneus ventricosus TaxID=182803 RepID=A0A4Y2BHQ1_ARAVE|nr:hypothetical protein AVEN_184459-1 [Araneus ventricosus]